MRQINPVTAGIATSGQMVKKVANWAKKTVITDWSKRHTEKKNAKVALMVFIRLVLGGVPKNYWKICTVARLNNQRQYTTEKG